MELTRPDVVVLGAGFAGLSAAVRLTRAGARVLVLEARSRLGGRATAFPDRDTGELVDNGQHVLMGCYTDTFEFLRDIGAQDNVRLDPQLAITMIDRAGRRTRLSCPALPAPLHLAAGVLEWEALSWRDRLSLLGMATPLKHARRELKPGATMRAASPDETVTSWLIRNGQTPRLRELLWDPLALAALNQPPEQAAAPPFARVLAEMFSDDPRAAAIALPTKPLHLMYAEPARAYLEAHGSAVRTGAAATITLTTDRRAVAGVRVGGEAWPADRVISSVPWFALGGLFDEAPPALHGVLDRAARMASSPIVTVNLWFDRPVLELPFVGLPGERCSGCSTNGWCSGDDARRTCRSSRAAPRTSWRKPTSSWSTGRTASCSTRCPASAPRDWCKPPSSASRARRSRSRPASRRVPPRKPICTASCWPATGPRQVCPRP